MILHGGLKNRCKPHPPKTQELRVTQSQAQSLAYSFPAIRFFLSRAAAIVATGHPERHRGLKSPRCHFGCVGGSLLCAAVRFSGAWACGFAGVSLNPVGIWSGAEPRTKMPIMAGFLSPLCRKTLHKSHFVHIFCASTPTGRYNISFRHYF